MTTTISEPLVGKYIRLESLAEAHLPTLEKNYDPELSRYFPREFPTAADYFSQIAVHQCFGPCELFAMIHIATGEAVGCSGYFHRDIANRKLEIGGTWVGTRFHNSGVNVESKLLLASQAFDARQCLRVAFRTDSLNQRSQAALEKLGIQKEGTLRNDLLRHDGRRRHSVYYSIIVEEWPKVRAGIEARLATKTKTRS